MCCVSVHCFYLSYTCGFGMRVNFCIFDLIMSCCRWCCYRYCCFRFVVNLIVCLCGCYIVVIVVVVLLLLLLRIFIVLVVVVGVAVGLFGLLCVCFIVLCCFWSFDIVSVMARLFSRHVYYMLDCIGVVSVFVQLLIIWTLFTHL